MSQYTSIMGINTAPNTRTMDANAMPSAEAEAARQKSAEVMAALRKGDQGEADRLMGKATKSQDHKSSGQGIFKKMFGKKDKEAKEEKAKDDGVIR